MITVTIADYREPHKSAIRSIRHKVFCLEQGVDLSLEEDGLDDQCVHALAFSDSVAVATGRIQSDGHIGRVAVLADYRKVGLGSRILKTLIDHARNSGQNYVYLAAQVDAVPFYRKLGFHETGSIFVEANIDHILMERHIKP